MMGFWDKVFILGLVIMCSYWFGNNNLENGYFGLKMIILSLLMTMLCKAWNRVPDEEREPDDK